MTRTPDTIEEYTAPWEKDGEELDAERAKKLLYNVLRERDNAQRELAAAKTSVTTLTAELDQAKTAAAEGARDGETQIQAVQRQLDELRTQTEKERTETTRENARLKVQAEMKLTDAQAKRLVGSSYDEMKADAEDLLGAFKPESADKEDGEEETFESPRNLLPGGRPESGRSKNSLPPYSPEALVKLGI